MEQIQNIRELASGNWLQLNEATYEDHYGNTRKWEYASRRNSNGVVTVILEDKKQTQVLLVRQYRVPTMAFTWEFPAGLINAGEIPKEAALRELKEETGYTGQINCISPLLYTSPGLSNESGYIVCMFADQEPTETKFDESEFIQHVWVPYDTMWHFLFEQQKINHDAVDNKVYMWMLTH